MLDSIRRKQLKNGKNRKPKKLFNEIFGNKCEFDPYDFNKWVYSMFDEMDPRDVCLIKNRYFKGMTLKATGKSVVHNDPERYGKKPCDGITGNAARVIIMQKIWMLRHISRRKLYPPFKFYMDEKLKEKLKHAVGQ